MQNWKINDFTYQQTQDWINIGLQPIDFNLAVWLRNTKQITAEKVLDHHNLEQLKQEFFNYQLETKVELIPK